MKHYEIFVTGKKGIFDPAGATAKRGLGNLGYDKVANVKIGKFIQLETQDDVSEDDVKEMCNKLLANPIIEDYSIRATDGAKPEGKE